MYGKLLLSGSVGVILIILISISGVILLVVCVIVKIKLVIIVGFVIGMMMCYSVFVFVVLSVSELWWIVFGICDKFFFVEIIIIGKVKIVKVNVD